VGALPTRTMTVVPTHEEDLAMHGSMPRRLALALFTVGVLSHGVALAEGDVSVALTAYRVTMSQGKEAYVPAEQARPGEVIEYRATYKNTGKQVVKDLMATLPVPQGLEYLPKTAAPSKLLASVDGKNYEAVPLVRRVKGADGKPVVREVPLSEYRFLRWPMGNLAASAESQVRARMRVTPLGSMAANSTH
jgi:uncharacterized repeat protein (TIGR01451 family)